MVLAKKSSQPFRLHLGAVRLRFFSIRCLLASALVLWVVALIRMTMVAPSVQPVRSFPPPLDTAQQDVSSGLAITSAFNYKNDAIRDKDRAKQQDDFKFIRNWYESFNRKAQALQEQHVPSEIKGVVLQSMFSPKFVQEKTTQHISFLNIDPATHPSFTTVPKADERTINDQRFFVLKWFLNETFPLDTNKKPTFWRPPSDYILFSDAWDVTFHKNPFQYMQLVDNYSGKYQLYVGEEVIPHWWWIEDVRQSCIAPSLAAEPKGNWKERQQHIERREIFQQEHRLFSTGTLGGHISVIRPLLRELNTMFLQQPNASAICDMAMLNDIVVRKYGYNVVSGFPFQTLYDCNERMPRSLQEHACDRANLGAILSHK